MKWLIGIIAALSTFVIGFALGWTLHRPKDVRVEAPVAIAASTPAAPLPTPIAIPSSPPSLPYVSSWTEDPAPFAWPAKRAPSRGVLAIDATHYIVDNGFIEDAVEKQTLATSARFVPKMEDGGAAGMKVFGIRPETTYAKLGLQNGDSIRSLNGMPMADPAAALEAYTRIRSAKLVALDIERHGAPMTLHYEIQR